MGAVMPPKRRPDPKKVGLVAVLGTLVATPLVWAATAAVALSVATAVWLGGGVNQPKVTLYPVIQPLTPPATGYITQDFYWVTTPNATAYRLWLDGVPMSIVKADPTMPMQGRSMSVSCSADHRFNVQGLNAASVGPLAPRPTYFSTGPC
jgi:hypothetical protein